MTQSRTISIPNALGITLNLRFRHYDSGIRAKFDFTHVDGAVVDDPQEYRPTDELPFGMTAGQFVGKLTHDGWVTPEESREFLAQRNGMDEVTVTE